MRSNTIIITMATSVINTGLGLINSLIYLPLIKVVVGVETQACIFAELAGGTP